MKWVGRGWKGKIKIGLDRKRNKEKKLKGGWIEKLGMVGCGKVLEEDEKSVMIKNDIINWSIKRSIEEERGEVLGRKEKRIGKERKNLEIEEFKEVGRWEIEKLIENEIEIGNVVEEWRIGELGDGEERFMIFKMIDFLIRK